MRGPRAALGAVLLGALTALAGVVTPTTALAEDPELTPVERFSSCVAGGGQGNLLLMFDTSGSLADTDPDAGRVTAATATMTRLAAKLADVPDLLPHFTPITTEEYAERIAARQRSVARRMIS